MTSMRARVLGAKNTLSRGVVCAVLSLVFFHAAAWSAERMEFAAGVKSRVNVPNETLVPNSEHPFASTEYVFQFEKARKSAWGDFNGDGFNDIVAAGTYFLWKPELPLQIWGNTGNGTFVNRTSEFISGPVPIVGSANNIFVNDFNNDGRADIYIVDQGLEDKNAYNPGMDGHTNHLLLSEADGKLHDRSSTLPGNVPAFNHFSSMADVNGDGNKDIVMTVLGGPTIGNGGVYFLLSDGKGGFTRTTNGIPLDFAFPWANNNTRDWHYPGSSTVCDLDDDGRGDLITGSYNTVDRLNKQRNVRIHQQQADGTFVEKRRDPIPAAIAAVSDAAGSFTAIGISQIVCGKLTGGKYNDVLVGWENRSKTFHTLLRNNGNFDFTDVTLATFGSYDSTYPHNSGRGYPVGQITVMDVDGDGFDDLFYKTNGGAEPQAMTEKSGFIHLNDGHGNFSPFRLAANGRQLTKAEAMVHMGCQFCDSTALVFDAGGSTHNDLVLLDSRVDMTPLPIVQSKAIGFTTLINTAPTPTKPSVIFSTAQTDSQSFLRFYNSGTTAGTVSVTLADYTTGKSLGQWTSTSLPAGSELQFPISVIEADLGLAGTKPSYYSVSVRPAIQGYFQHVLFRPGDGTLTNLSTCAVNVTADPSKLSGVHTSIVGAAGFPSTVVVNNTGAAAAAVTLGVFDARNGTRLGTHVTSQIPASGQKLLTVATIEAGAGITPSASMGHYVITAEGAFTGFLQHLVDNQRVGVVTDMTTACALSGTPASAVSPLKVGAVFSTAQTTSQSFLRFYNASTTAGTVTATVRDFNSGNSLGTWTSPTIAAGAEVQYATSAIEGALNLSSGKPSYYSVALQPSFSGFFQHVLFRPSDGTLTNLSTCALGVTADATRLSGVHTSIVGAAGYPSTLAINNTAGVAAGITLAVYDARNGVKLGSYATPAVPANGQTILTVAALEVGANFIPTASMGHYVIKVEGNFTGFLQHLVTNNKVGVVTDMTTACSLTN